MATPRAWALVPARGGSKSIPRKNLVDLCGRPMLAYGIAAAHASSALERIVCSTDDMEIAACARACGADVDMRPAELATDTAAVSAVAREFLQRMANVAPLPEILILVQPTSPFLRPSDCTALLAAMSADPECRSGQTICLPPHNHHAFNQRVLAGARVAFHFRAERERAYNKQLKPVYYVFGNLVAAKTAALLEGADFFAEPSAAVMIERPYDLDVDGETDLILARALISSGAVRLDHMASR